MCAAVCIVCAGTCSVSYAAHDMATEVLAMRAGLLAVARPSASLQDHVW